MEEIIIVIIKKLKELINLLKLVKNPDVVSGKILKNNNLVSFE